MMGLRPICSPPSKPLGPQRDDVVSDPYFSVDKSDPHRPLLSDKSVRLICVVAIVITLIVGVVVGLILLAVWCPGIIMSDAGIGILLGTFALILFSGTIVMAIITSP
jgi:hypothetical protein